MTVEVCFRSAGISYFMGMDLVCVQVCPEGYFRLFIKRENSAAYDTVRTMFKACPVQKTEGPRSKEAIGRSGAN